MLPATAGAGGGDSSAKPAIFATKREASGSHEQGMSSNARELSGVLLTVQAVLPSLRGKQVLVETDNKAARLV